jgi:hypothetical protein
MKADTGIFGKKNTPIVTKTRRIGTDEKKAPRGAFSFDDP